MSELNVAQPAAYFNLHAEGCGYLNRVRTVKPEKGSPYLACTIAAKHGDATSPMTTKFDCRISGTRAQAIVQQLEAAVKAEKRVILVVTRGFDLASKSAGRGARSGWCRRDQNGVSVAVGGGPRSGGERSSLGW